MDLMRRLFQARPERRQHFRKTRTEIDDAAVLAGLIDRNLFETLDQPIRALQVAQDQVCTFARRVFEALEVGALQLARFEQA